jgi:type IV secretion system protein VirB9
MSDDRILAALLLLLCAVGRSEADNVPRAGVTDPRLRTAAYSAEQVYKLYGVVGYQIDIEFEPGETYVGIGAGDLGGLTLGAHENHLILKPKVASVGTNLTVFTTRRHYQFEYSASAQQPKELTDDVMYAVRFTYPPPPAAQDPLTLAERVELELARAESHRSRNHDYWFCGNPRVKPTAASDDGIHTRLTFPTNAELPAIFVRNDDDTESLLNYSMDAGDVVIYRVAAQFIVRRGRLTGCIVNKRSAGSSQRLTSGTVAPTVTRERKEVEP